MVRQCPMVRQVGESMVRHAKDVVWLAVRKIIDRTLCSNESRPISTTDQQKINLLKRYFNFADRWEQ